MDMPVPFHQNFDVEFHQPFETLKPLPAVYIGIRRRKVAAHESITRQQQFLLGIVKNDVVITMAGSG